MLNPRQSPVNRFQFTADGRDFIGLRQVKRGVCAAQKHGVFLFLSRQSESIAPPSIAGVVSRPRGTAA
jgi:hypothetical protein